MKCSRCRVREARRDRKRCYRCVRYTAEVNRLDRARRAATLPLGECGFCEKPFPTWHARQAFCTPACRDAMQEQARGYVPIDEWERRPSNVVIRALRYRGWLTAEEIGDVLGMENGKDEMAARTRWGTSANAPPRASSKERNTLSKQIARALEAGLVEVRPGYPQPEYRISPSVPVSVRYYMPEAA